MKGVNKLTLSKATVLEALQEYFSARYRDPIRVIDIDMPYTGAGEFTTTVEELPPAAPTTSP